MCLPEWMQQLQQQQRGNERKKNCRQRLILNREQLIFCTSRHMLNKWKNKINLFHQIQFVPIWHIQSIDTSIHICCMALALAWHGWVLFNLFNFMTYTRTATVNVRNLLWCYTSLWISRTVHAKPSTTPDPNTTRHLFSISIFSSFAYQLHYKCICFSCIFLFRGKRT